MPMNSLERQLAKHEGLRLKPYRCTAGKLTIGYGRNLEDNGITKAEALTMLRNDIANVKAELERLGWWRRLDDTRQDVIANMAFNIGLTRLLTFKRMIAAIEDADYTKAADEMMDSKWAAQVGSRAVELARKMKGEDNE